jgi:hypothetical protein
MADQELEFKISNRRSVQQVKELKEQLRKEAKARELAEVEGWREGGRDMCVSHIILTQPLFFV